MVILFIDIYNIMLYNYIRKKQGRARDPPGARTRESEKGRYPMKFEQMTISGISPQTPAGKTQVMKLFERMEAERSFEAFSAGDILTTLIGFTNPTDKAPQIAGELLDTFGSLKGVLEARSEQLRAVPGVGAKTAALISAIVPFVRVWNREAMTAPDRIGNSREAEKYCLSLLAGRRTEGFYVIALNAQCRILGTRLISEGSLSEVSAYPRMVMETALNYNAHSVMLCHNHPGGTCAPSPEDIASTTQLQRLLNGVGILVLDHIIVANESTYSMIQHGDINYRVRT